MKQGASAPCFVTAWPCSSYLPLPCHQHGFVGGIEDHHGNVGHLAAKIGQRHQGQVLEHMGSHSGRMVGEVRDGVLFDLFPDVDRAWFERKANMVFQLNNRAFSTWEQRPYLLRFSNYRPITGSAPHMYQNLTLVPLADFGGEVTHLAIMIYDATDEAMLITGQRQG